MIANDPRWNPEMLAALRRQAAAGIAAPAPFDEQRRAADAIVRASGRGGPRMAHTEDRWVLARGRRVACRVLRPVDEQRPLAPAPGAGLPVLVYLHGGGWVFGSLDTYDRLMRGLAAGGGCAVVGVDYALSPEAVFPQALEECEAVLRRVVAEAESWGLDPGRVVLGGDSAGANLAFAVAMRLRDAEGAGTDPAWRALRGVLAVYPVCDAAMDSATYREFADGYGLAPAEMAAFWEHYAPTRQARRDDPCASVLRGELRGLPPTLVLAAELDVLRGEGESMADRLRAAGVAVAHRTAAGMAHGFLRELPDAARSVETLATASAWLRERTTS